MSAEPVEPVSVRASIEAAMTELEEKGSLEINNQKDVEAPETSKIRDENGKFVKKSEKETPEPKEIEKPPGVTELEKPKYKVPKSWEADEKIKADYEALPEHIKQALDKREKEVEYGFTKLDEERNFGKQLKEVITPYMPIITAEGGNPVAAVQSLLNTAYLLRTAPQERKAQLIQQIAQQYGVDLGSIQQQPNSYRLLPPEIQDLKSELDFLKNNITQQKTLQEQQEQAKIQGEIQAFAADPKNAYFEQVKAAMAPLLGSGQAKDLQEAYDMACWANPQIRSTLMAAQEKEQQEKRKSEIAQKKQASVSVIGSPGPQANSGKSKKSLRDELSDVYDELAGSKI